MAENNQQAGAEEKREGVIAEAGAPVKGNPFKSLIDKALNTGEDNNAGAAGNAGSADDEAAKIAAAAAAKKAAETQNPAEVNEDAIKEYFKKQGIEYGGVDDLKKKLTAKEAAADLTDEQKKAAATAKEQRLLALHIGRGGTIEQFTSFQKQSTMEPGELGKLKLALDLKNAGFPEEKITSVIKKMHLDVSDEELAELSPEDQAEIKKEREFGLSKLNSRGSIFKKMAADYLVDLERQATDEDTNKATKKQHASNVEAAFTAYQRKQKLEFGKVDDLEVPPVEFDIPETVISSVKDSIKDKAKWESQIYNKDGSVNLDYILPHLIKSEAYSIAAKTALLEGETRGAEKALKGFSPKPPALGGTNGGEQGRKGQLTAAGAPVRGNPYQRK